MAGLNKIAYFVGTKRPGMFVGPCDVEKLESLIGVIKQAKAEKKGIVFFLWQNDSGKGKSVASLTVAVQQDRPEGARARPIGGGFGSRPTPDTARPPARSPALDNLFGTKPAAAEESEDEGF